jgi:curved DNA-binding protein CbpA
MNTLYDVLGVPQHANEKAIRTAFRKAAKSFHPDLNAGDPTAELQFRQLVAAYDLLKNPQQREAYDRQLKEDRRLRFRRIASPIISGLVSGSIVAAVMLWLNAQRPPEPPPAPRLAMTDDRTGQATAAADKPRKEEVSREGGENQGGASPAPASDAGDKDTSDEQLQQLAGLPPLPTQPEAPSPLAMEWERVQAAGDAMAIWEFAVRNPDAPEAQLARARLLTLIETSENVFLLQVLRIGAPDGIAERARARLARLGVAATTNEATINELTSPDPSSSPLEERAAAFVSGQIAAWFPLNARNLPTLTKAYAEEVYYNGGLMTRSVVIRDKRHLSERTQERSYSVQSGSMKTECVATVCRVGGTLDWQTRNTPRLPGAGAATPVTTGTIEFEYGLIYSRGAFSILSENSTPVKIPLPEARPLPSRQEAAKQQASRQEPKQETKQEAKREPPTPEPKQEAKAESSAQEAPKQEPPAQDAPKQEPSAPEPPDNP